LPLPLESSAIRAILLDIEGTTTPIDFVFKTLFPFAAEHVEEFLREHSSDPEIKTLNYVPRGAALLRPARQFGWKARRKQRSHQRLPTFAG
jgi:hypothetical protein